MKKCEVYIQLEKKLQKMGIGPGSRWFKDILSPSWWNSSLSSDESLCIQLVSFIASRLRIPAKSLISANEDPLLTADVSVAYKIQSNKTQQNVQYSTSVLSTVTDIVTSDFPQTFHPADANSIRAVILKKNPWVNFYALLDYCWSQKIPVLHVSAFPAGGETTGWMKPAAATIRGKHGYAIFLCTEYHSQSRIVFDLAHELGHIMKGHLQEKIIHIDTKDNFYTSAEQMEKDANLFAEELLGSFDLSLCSSPEALAYLATQSGRTKNVDPGHLILRYGFIYKKYAFAEKALSIIEQKKKRDKKTLFAELVSMINEKAFAALKLDELKPDDAKTLCGLTGIIQEPVL